jgi:cytidylate kinase
MPIITMFGGTFGDDEELATNVARSLDCRYVGRDLLANAARRAEVPEAKLDEILEKEPRWWERWQENLRPYRIALQAAMTEAALAENLVYYGHVGHGLLPGIRHVVRVLLSAPMEFRLEQVRGRQGLDTNAARRYIQHVERARTRRLMALFGRDWRDPEQYAVILNRAQITSTGAEKVIAHTAQLFDYQATAESRQALEDLALMSRIEAHLLTFPRLRNLTIGVKARAGDITLSGVIPAFISKGEITREIEAVAGVKNVLADLIGMPGHARRFG